MTTLITEIATGDIAANQNDPLCDAIDAAYPSSVCDGVAVKRGYNMLDAVDPTKDQLTVLFLGTAPSLAQLDAVIAAFIASPTPAPSTVGLALIDNGTADPAYAQMDLTVGTTGELGRARLEHAKWHDAARILAEEFAATSNAGETNGTVVTSGAGATVSATAGGLDGATMGAQTLAANTSATGSAAITWPSTMLATNLSGAIPARLDGDLLVFTVYRVRDVSVAAAAQTISVGLGSTFTGGSLWSDGIAAYAAANGTWSLAWRLAGVTIASSSSIRACGNGATAYRMAGLLLTSTGVSFFETALPSANSIGQARAPGRLASTLVASGAIATIPNASLTGSTANRIGPFVRSQNTGITAAMFLDCAAIYLLAP